MSIWARERERGRERSRERKMKLEGETEGGEEREGREGDARLEKRDGQRRRDGNVSDVIWHISHFTGS